MEQLTSNPAFWSGIFFTVIVLVLIAVFFGLLNYISARLAVRHELREQGLIHDEFNDRRKP